ncbi:MAG: type I methionyl aminopeptidase [Aggregatilineales bacterium]|nr:type I methionyl aminopeptidase [Chloroflexota bacterium]HOA23615.1 type I methionyl aminopeptidase [Aggregatilineales bacterium]HPV08258.1 type I methionyl aminopeptidase [Aggregatilineales bacterium]HQE17088.1 type I methionyl aminopeptidase [Aggregatilineales bacterium]
MTIESEQDLAGLKEIGRIVALTLREMCAYVRPGITTAELDEVGAAALARYGARSAPQVMYNFPGATCISLNNVAAHGIPNDRVIKEGDLVNIDVSAVLDGYYGDTAATVPVPPVSDEAERLARCAQNALAQALAVVRAGAQLNAIGLAVERTAAACGFEVIRNLPGHGIGRTLHEPPSVLNFYHPRASMRLTEGMVFTIEPFLSISASSVDKGDDGWALTTSDGSLAAQYEHTVVVTRGEPLILTQL